MSRVRQRPQPPPPPLTVYRPRRRCPRCRLVNTDSARRCKRCFKSFVDIDPARESEALVDRIRTRNVITVAILTVLLGGLATAGVMAYRRVLEAEQYAVKVRRVSADLGAVSRGSRSDARMLLDAFDEGEARAVLATQAGAWSDRARRCAELKEELDRLVPPNPELAGKHMDIELKMADLDALAREMSKACAAGDTAAGRRAVQSSTSVSAE